MVRTQARGRRWARTPQAVLPPGMPAGRAHGPQVGDGPWAVRLYCLQAALEDVDRDLAASAAPADVADAFRWLLDNARPLAEVWIEPRTADLR